MVSRPKSKSPKTSGTKKDTVEKISADLVSALTKQKVTPVTVKEFSNYERELTICLAIIIWLQDRSTRATTSSTRATTSSPKFSGLQRRTNVPKTIERYNIYF